MQLTAKCMFCSKAVTSTGASRLVDHLVGCLLCPKEVKEVGKAMRLMTACKRSAKDAQLKMQQQEAIVQEEMMKVQKVHEQQTGIREGFRSAECTLADKAVAQFFYANGISFTAAGDSEVDNQFRNMCDAIRRTPPSWIPPGRKKLSGPLIDSCYNDMTYQIDSRDAQGIFADKFGYSYTQDGWDSVHNLPLINSAYFCAGMGGVYLRSVDTSGKSKDAAYIANLMIADIYKIGCTKVVTVVTDTCATMEKAWGYVMDEFPWITALPCVPHVVSLMMKDVGKLPDVDQLIKDESTVVGWFSNHQIPLAILRRKVYEKFHRPYELIKAGATRFAINTLVGERLQKLKYALMSTVTDSAYLAQNFKDRADEREYTNCEVHVRKHKGSTARKFVLDEEPSGFWSRVACHVNATLPMFHLLRRHDTTAPSVGKVYNGFFQVGEHIKENCADVSYQQDLLDIHHKRWCYGGDGPFFCAAYMLDPEFISHQQSSNSEVVEGLPF